MTFTALHRALGVAHGPLTDDLLNAAVAAGVVESHDLDWKSELPPAKGLPQTDFPKDVAAMANSGGGVIIYGVREAQGAATERVDVGEFNEPHERALRSAAITAISPPLFGLNVHRIGATDKRAVVVEVPASVDGPHLIYRGEYFGAPVRNNSDTVWMRERQIEAMYRARFNEQRHATEALDNLYKEAANGRKTERHAWLIAVAHPRVPNLRGRLTQDEARTLLSNAEDLAFTYVGRNGSHPIETADRLNPRPGLNRWVAVYIPTIEREKWEEAWLSIHHDGSVTLATVIGGYPLPAPVGNFPANQIMSSDIECCIADFMAALRTTAEATDNTEYDVRVGIEWKGQQPLLIATKDNFGFPYAGVSIPLPHYTPVETTVNAKESALNYYWHVHDLARDCVNQGGISNVRMIQPPPRADDQP